jgi:hypothetical protein
MPEMYPKKLFDTQEKRDAFWNLRLWAFTAYFPCFAIGFGTHSSKVISWGLSIIFALAYLFVIFRYNIFGRMMAKFKWINEES